MKTKHLFKNIIIKILLLFFLLTSFFPNSQFTISCLKENTPISMEDILNLNLINEYISSPDGEIIAYTVSSWDKENNKNISHIKGINYLTKEEFDITKLTYPNQESNLVIINPLDLKTNPKEYFILFLRGGKIFYRPLSSSYVEAKLLLAYPVDIISFKANKDMIVLEVEVYQEFGDHMILTQLKDTKEKLNEYNININIQPRFGNVWLKGKALQLFSQKVKMNFKENTITPINSPTNISKLTIKNNFSHLLPKYKLNHNTSNKAFLSIPPNMTLFGGMSGKDYYDISPSGKKVVFTAIINRLNNYQEDNLTENQDQTEGEYSGDLSIREFKNWRIFLIDLPKENDDEAYMTLISHEFKGKCSFPKFFEANNDEEASLSKEEGKVEFSDVSDGYIERTKVIFLASEQSAIENSNSQFKIYDNGVVRSFPKMDHNILTYSIFNENMIMFITINQGYRKIGYQRLDIEQAKGVLIHDENNDYYSSSGNHLIKIGLNSPEVLTLRSSWNKTPELFTFIMKFYDQDLNTNPSEVSNYPLFKQITNINKEKSIDKRLGNFENHVFTNSKGKKIQSFIIFPLNFDNKKTYPLVTNIHGGPESAHQNIFSASFYNPQLLSKGEYITLLINPTGSEGFGEEFKKEIRGDWGGRPALDIIEGVLSMKEKEYVNFEKKCLLGHSFGGFLTNYIRGKIKNLKIPNKNTGKNEELNFNCYITINGIFNTREFSYSNDFLGLAFQDFCLNKDNGCKPYDPEFTKNFDEFSPESLLLENPWGKEPHLVIHAQDDYRVAWSEGQSLFNYLQLNKIKSKYLFFKGESHVVTNNKNTIKMDEEITEFIKENIENSSS